jgi:PTH1 family peptidyl-tRNA hydrolase
LPGQVKMKLGGSAAGHNGLKDIEAQLGSADFWRLRLGIGHPGVKAQVVDYVLRKPMAEQREAIDKSIDQAVSAMDLLIEGDMERAMMKIHARPPRPKPPRPERLPTPSPLPAPLLSPSPSPLPSSSPAADPSDSPETPR